MSEVDQSHPWGPFGDILETVLTKTYYGHTMGEVLEVSLLLEQVVDAAAVSALGRPDEWVQAVLQEEVWHRVPQDRKLHILQTVLARNDVDAGIVATTTAAVRDVWGLRNTMAHSTLADPALGDVGLKFEGYRRGKESTKELTPERVTAILAGGRDAFMVIVALLPRHEPPSSGVLPG